MNRPNAQLLIVFLHLSSLAEFTAALTHTVLTTSAEFISKSAVMFGSSNTFDPNSDIPDLSGKVRHVTPSEGKPRRPTPSVTL